MKILFLGAASSPLVPVLESRGDSVFATEEKLTGSIDLGSFGLLVSYNYRHILRKPVLDLFPERAWNLHISCLPWNRGAHPNFWSFYENTPAGVTIHQIDEGIDTGDILLQKQVPLSLDASLSENYGVLHREIVRLFEAHWDELKAGKVAAKKQPSSGSFHKKADLVPLEHLLAENGWNTLARKIYDAGAAAKAHLR